MYNAVTVYIEVGLFAVYEFHLHNVYPPFPFSIYASNQFIAYALYSMFSLIHTLIPIYSPLNVQTRLYTTLTQLISLSHTHALIHS